VTDWNALTVDKLVARACRRHRHRPAVLLESGDCRTYGDLDDRSWRLVNALNGLGYHKGSVVGILASNCPEYLEIEFACARGGFLKVPFYVRNSVAEHVFFIEDAGVEVLIGEARQLAALSAHLASSGSAAAPVLIALDGSRDVDALSYEAQLANASAHPTPPQIDPTDPYQIRYTSGTTGRPKGAVTNHLAMAVASLGNVVHSSIEDAVLIGDVLQHYVPFSHASTFNIVGQSLTGVVHLPSRRWDPEEFLAIVERHRVSNVLLMPTQLNILMNEASNLGRTDTSSLKTIVYGGEPMPKGVLAAAIEVFGPVLTQGYGSTEAPSMIVGLPKADHVGEGAKALRSACGYPMPWVEVAIVDSDDKHRAVGEVGELCVKGPFLLDRYHNQPEATRRALRGGWYHTNDIAYVDDEGCIFLADRSSDMIISGGFNIYPAEVEAALLTHRSVVECAVFGVPDPRWGESVCAVIRIAPGASLTMADLASHCQLTLGRYKFPKRIFVSDQPLPTSDAGKTLRRSVRDQTSTLAELS
jgi:acyl-CoA synthetase (AMP-forming)/AMP-acid ligase II